MSRRGFANPEYLIVLVIICVLLAIAVPQFFRVRQRSHDRGLIAAVAAMTQAEHAYFASHHRYSDSLVVPLVAGIKLEQVRADSSGWSVVAVTDSVGRPEHRCGVFEGEQFRPLDGRMERSGEMACW